MMRVGALIVRMLRIECLWLECQKTEILRIRILRIRMLRVRAYSEKGILRIPLGAGARARGKKRMGSAGKARGEARVARGKPIGRSTWNAHEKHA